MVKVFFDIAKQVARKVASKLTRKVATKAATKATEKGAKPVGSKTGQLIGENIYASSILPNNQNTRDRTQEMLNSTNKTLVFISVPKRIKEKKSSNFCQHKRRTTQ